MDSHLDEVEREMGNRRNGHMSKQVQTSMGEITINTPRDRDGTFDPKVMRKREKIFADRIIGLYAIGNRISAETINNITDRVLPEKQNRRVQDIFIACVDGLKGFPDAIASVFPQTTVQLCIVHQIRNSVKYVSSRNQKEFMRDLKLVYQAVNKDAAEKALDDLEIKWGEDYPIVIKSWHDNWDRLTAYFQYSQHIRRIIYTTNTVEGYHRQLRKVTKNKGVFTSDTALEKLVYLAFTRIRKKWTQPVQNWGQTAQQLAILFQDRFRILA